jgi:multidrug efflux pump subunit AcrA (membrane-fusion protein)
MRASLKRFAVLSALSLAGAGAALAQTPPVKAGPLPPSVTVASADEREIVERAVVTGTLVPRDEVLVAPEIEGLRITEVLVEEGAVVKQGQVLARLSRDILETQLAQNTASVSRAEAAIAQAKSQILQSEAAQVEANAALERTRALMRGGNTTDAVLEQRVSAARVGEGRLAASRDALAWPRPTRPPLQAQRQEIQVRLARTEIRARRPGSSRARTRASARARRGRRAPCSASSRTARLSSRAR